MCHCVSLSFAEGAQCPPAGGADVWRCGIHHPHQDIHCEFLLCISPLVWSQSHTRELPYLSDLWPVLPTVLWWFPTSLPGIPAAAWNAISSLLLCALARAVLLPSTCSGAELSLPGCSIYLLLSSLQVAKELVQEICEQMGAGEQEEIQEFALFAIRSTSDKNGK